MKDSDPQPLTLVPYYKDGVILSRRLRSVWEWLVKPSARHQQPDIRHQSQLLAGLLLVVILLGVQIETFMLIFTPVEDRADWLIIPTILLLGMAFFLNRAGRFSASAWITIVIQSLATFVVTFNTGDRPIEVDFLAFLFVPLLFAGMLLAEKIVLVLAALYIWGMALSPAFVPGVDLVDVLVGPASFMALAGGMIFLIIRHRNVLESDRRRELVEKEERYRTLLETSYEGICIIGGGLILDANPNFARLFGHSLSDVLEEPISRFLPLEFQADGSSSIQDLNGHPSEVPVYRKDGSLFYVEIISRKQAYRGQPAQVIAIRDITERVKAQQAQDNSERLYRALFESANDAILLLNLERNYIAANQKTTDLLDYSADELVGMGVKDIVAPYEYSDAMTKLDKLLERGSLPLYERIFKRKDGTEVPVEINVSLIRDRDGEPLYIQSVARDITERKRAEKDLKEVNRSLKVLSECNQVLIRTTKEQDLLDKICRVIVQEGGYHLAWVGYAEQDEPKSVRTKAQAGLEGRYFDNLVISWADDTKGQGPAGRAIRTGKPVIVTDMRSYPHHAPWFPKALESGAVACTALPLRANGTSLGVLNICSEDPDSFHTEEVKLLCELADDLAFGIITLRMREEHKMAGAKIKHQIKKLEALRNIDIAITSSLDLRVTFDILLSETTGILGVDAAAVLSYSPQSQTLDFVTGKGFSTTALQHTHLRLGESHAGQAALERRTIHIQNLNQQKTGFLRSPFLAQENFCEYFGVPLIAKGQLKGVLEIFNRSPLNSDQEWLGMLETLAGQAAIAIDNLELFQNLQKSHTDVVIAYDSTLEGWSGALDLRDEETEGHTQRVTELTLQLARAMGIENQDLVNIRRGALLHDIGKMGIPDRILLKPGPLTEEEWEIMRKHPTYAYKLLSPIAYLRPALEIPYCHHEKWDGTGYPRGLKGEEIPLAARIFAVVDVWDALRSDRPYRKAWSEEQTLEFIEEQAGKHFDPEVVRVFLGLERF
jgi:PAS domain S-box-containing protein/putative nucleotidyltransferase with HDIG domain